jgi:catechol 2,3-dioxygenase-like lactoylglutathione lyase family enzyme
VINAVLHHLGIGLIEPREAESFFDSLLGGFLNLQKEITQEAVAGWKGRGTRFYLYPVSAGSVPGSLQHIAFAARSRVEVDSFLPWASARGVRILSGPRAYPEYGGDYYAVFFEGPEGLRLELVHLTEADGAASL